MINIARQMGRRWRCAIAGVALQTTDLLLARACCGCSQAFAPGQAPEGWCSPCLRAITCERPRCQRCGLPSHHTPCPSCQATPPPFEHTVVLGAYQPPLDRVIRAFKFGRQPALGRALAAALAPSVTQALAQRPPTRLPPIVVAIPLANERLAERGYNQSLLIARALAARCGLGLSAGALRRTRAGQPQSSLSRNARQPNIAHAFVAAHPLNQPVLLIDDVMTTGATLVAASRALLEAGAPSVTCAVIARTPAPDLTPLPDVSRRPGSP